MGVGVTGLFLYEMRSLYVRLALCAISFVSRCLLFFFFSSRRRHTRFDCDWSSDVCSSDLFSMARHRMPDGKTMAGGLVFFDYDVSRLAGQILERNPNEVSVVLVPRGLVGQIGRASCRERV